MGRWFFVVLVASFDANLTSWHDCVHITG